MSFNCNQDACQSGIGFSNKNSLVRAVNGTLYKSVMVYVPISTNSFAVLSSPQGNHMGYMSVYNNTFPWGVVFITVKQFVKLKESILRANS